MSSKVQRRCAQLPTFTLSIDFTHIPHELIEVEILSRLDVKTLHKFKCVSKRYESIISHPKFGLAYTQKAYSSPESMSSSGLRPTMLFPFTDLSRFVKDSGTFSKMIKDLASAGNQEEDTLPISVNSISLPDIMSHVIVASTDGLVLSIYYEHPLHRISFIPLWVSNPLTKQCIMLPHNGLVTSSLGIEYGFASRRDQATDLLTYKVVTVVQATDLLTYNVVTYKWYFPKLRVVTVHIFSSETGRWVPLEVPLPERVFTIPHNCFSRKGCLYFYNMFSGYVLTYNPYDSPGRFDRIPLPANSDSFQTSLVHSDDAVRCWEMIECDNGDGGVAVTVWRLGDAKPWWCFERRFRLPSPARACFSRMVALYPWDPDVICHAYLEGSEMAVVNQRRGTWESVDVTYSIPGYEAPLINIHLTPWSSPFYAQT